MSKICYKFRYNSRTVKRQDLVGKALLETPEKNYFQVCYLLANEDTVKREFSVLEKIRDNYLKYVISMDELDRSRNGIIHLNIRTFLLEWNHS